MPVELTDHIRAALQSYGVTGERIALGAAVFVATLVGTMFVATAVLVRLPATYFQVDHSPVPDHRARAVRVVRAIAKNVAGVALLMLGIVLSIPGVPGQGILTALIGLLLIDLPGKRALERRIVRQPKVLASINRLRVRFGREPIRL